MTTGTCVSGGRLGYYVEEHHVYCVAHIFRSSFSVYVAPLKFDAHHPTATLQQMVPDYSSIKG